MKTYNGVYSLTKEEVITIIAPRIRFLFGKMFPDERPLNPNRIKVGEVIKSFKKNGYGFIDDGSENGLFFNKSEGLFVSWSENGTPQFKLGNDKLPMPSACSDNTEGNYLLYVKIKVPQGNEAILWVDYKTTHKILSQFQRQVDAGELFRATKWKNIKAKRKDVPAIGEGDHVQGSFEITLTALRRRSGEFKTTPKDERYQTETTHYTFAQLGVDGAWVECRNPLTPETEGAPVIHGAEIAEVKEKVDDTTNEKVVTPKLSLFISPKSRRVSPYVRGYAEGRGVNIDDIEGTGKDGSPTKEDVNQYCAKKFVEEIELKMGIA